MGMKLKRMMLLVLLCSLTLLLCGCRTRTNGSPGILLPDAEETEKYLPTNDERICIPTERAIREGAYAGKNPGSGCWWWLRTPSISMPNYVCVVDVDGSFDDNGFPVNTFEKNNDGNIVVRPVIVLDLNL